MTLTRSALVGAAVAAAVFVACTADPEPRDEVITTPGAPPSPQVSSPNTAPTAASPSGACEDFGTLAGNSLTASLAKSGDTALSMTSFAIGGRATVTKARIIAVGDASSLAGKPAVLGADVNANLSTCTHCLLVAIGCGADCVNAAWFYARAGKATFTAVPNKAGEPFAGAFENVELVQVSIDPSTMVTTPVAAGGCIRVPSLTFSSATEVAPTSGDGGASSGSGGSNVNVDDGGGVGNDGGSQSGGGGGGKGINILL